MSKVVSDDLLSTLSVLSDVVEQDGHRDLAAVLRAFNHRMRDEAMTGGFSEWSAAEILELALKETPFGDQLLQRRAPGSGQVLQPGSDQVLPGAAARSDQVSGVGAEALQRAIDRRTCVSCDNELEADEKGEFVDDQYWYCEDCADSELHTSACSCLECTGGRMDGNVEYRRNQ